MISGKKLAVVMPAYNAEKTLRQTYQELPHEYVDEVILVDDGSKDGTAALARQLGIRTVIHPQNKGYGANQKTCYRQALQHGADIVVMVHPDYQYSPKLVTAMVSMITSGHFDIVLGSRILGGEALRGGMPRYKYIANRLLTLFENLLIGIKLSEYHTGYRAYTRAVLESLPLDRNSDDFVFDNEVIVQAAFFGFKIGELSCPAKYFEEASSIGFVRSMIYGMGVLGCAVKFVLQKAGIARFPLFEREGHATARKLPGGVG